MSELETIRSSSVPLTPGENKSQNSGSISVAESVAGSGADPLADFDGEALLTMARLQKTLKNYSESLQYFQFAFEIDRQFSTLLEWAQLLLEQGQTNQALQLYFRALNEINLSDPERFNLYKDIGNICLKNQDIEGAEENYHRAFALAPDSDALLVNMGTLELQRGCLEQAKIRFRESLAKNRKNENAWLGLALVHRQFGDVELAWANLMESLDLNATNSTGLQLLTDWSYRDGRLQTAIGILQNAKVIQTANGQWQLVLAQMFFDLGNMEAAAHHTEQVLNRNPLIPGGAELLALVERRRFDQRTAVASKES